MTIPMTITISLSEYLAMGRTIDSLREQVEKLEKQLTPELTKVVREDSEYGLREVRHTLRFAGLTVGHQDCRPKERREHATVADFKAYEERVVERLGAALGREVLKGVQVQCQSTIEEAPLGLDFFRAPAV